MSKYLKCVNFKVRNSVFNPVFGKVVKFCDGVLWVNLSVGIGELW